ncbi:replication initiation protein, partial [Helicobacter pylori]
MKFDQLDLQKALKILDALPQTIKELLSKHEIKKEELKPTLIPKPIPTKAPQTTPTPCKDLVVSTPKDNTYTTYHNNTN